MHSFIWIIKLRLNVILTTADDEVDWRKTILVNETVDSFLFFDGIFKQMLLDYLLKVLSFRGYSVGALLQQPIYCLICRWSAQRLSPFFICAPVCYLAPLRCCSSQFGVFATLPLTSCSLVCDGSELRNEHVLPLPNQQQRHFFSHPHPHLTLSDWRKDAGKSVAVD